MERSPKLAFTTGEQVRALRHKLGKNQAQFWGPLGIT